ncbi:uncharacterized protein FIBRA_01686 [Fibroporia radiculosa]|uniref:C2H2-type domain-containing protein n=1 Tax=Fibroporia radiculosa TaxID=599839 RepID=J4GL09_9APHY|nr:uncharacterized protein FIBRA_01686 [Fibroporia radiculosa]CCL99665.1 predicted protein [Fibroporia radiculosa]
MTPYSHTSATNNTTWWMNGEDRPGEFDSLFFAQDSLNIPSDTTERAISFTDADSAQRCSCRFQRPFSGQQRLYENSARTYANFLNEINGAPGISLTRLNDNVGTSYDEHLYTFDPVHLGARRSVHVSRQSSADMFPGYRLVSLQDATELFTAGVHVLCLVDTGAGPSQTNTTEPAPYTSEWSTTLVPVASPSNAIRAPALAVDGSTSVASIQSVVYPPVVDPRRTTHAMGSEMSMAASQGPMPVPQTGPLETSVDAHTVPRDASKILVCGQNVAVEAAFNTTEMLDRGMLTGTYNHGHSGICGSSPPGCAVDVLEPARRLQSSQSQGERVLATKICEWAGCNARLDDASASSVRRHFEEHHAADYRANNEDRDARQQLVCRWGQCKRKVKRGSFMKHIRTVHLRMTEVVCKGCGRVLVRQDALARHQAKFGH